MHPPEPTGAGLVRFLACVALVSACGGEPEARSAADSAPAVPPSATPAAVGDTGCPKTGNWQVCSVEDRLTRAGLVIERLPEPAVHDFLHTEGVRFRVGGGEDEVHIFVYPSIDARVNDTGALDSITVSPRGERRSYRVPPLLVTSANLAAIVFTLNERTSERLSLALSAGLPQR